MVIVFNLEIKVCTVNAKYGQLNLPRYGIFSE